MQSNSNSGGNGSSSRWQGSDSNEKGHYQQFYRGRGRGVKLASQSQFQRKIAAPYSQNKFFEEQMLNQSLYFNMLQIFESRNKVLLSKYPSHFVEDCLRYTEMSSTHYNFICERPKHHQPGEEYQKPSSTDDLIFMGYPSGNYLKQICVVMALWFERCRFPIKFKEIESLLQYDETEHFVQSLSKLTPYICDIFKEINNVNESNKSPRALQKEICEFLCLLEPKGFLTCLGVRMTIGSQHTVLLPEREELTHMFNRMNKPLSEEELLNNPNPSLISVGARAVQKHAARQQKNSCFWIDKNCLNGMTEVQKNAKAEEVIGNMIENCQWINIHTLHPDSMQFILEIRDAQGYGARWEIQGQFRGLVEPQNKFKNQKKHHSQQEQEQ